LLPLLSLADFISVDDAALRGRKRLAIDPEPSLLSWYDIIEMIFLVLRMLVSIVIVNINVLYVNNDVPYRIA
jgi:hypothetical protein